LQQLFDILSNEENAATISWLPHGNGFVIHKKKAFANEILPKHFKASKFTSFTRKLNRWGFSRAPRGPETGAYFHKLFNRDKPEMVLQMTSNSGNKVQTSTQGGPLLPSGAVPMMMPSAPGTMPFYMPQAQMAMLTPQQQQAFWHQQMQLYQFQQMQMFQFQQQQQAAAASGGGAAGSVQPMMFPSMMMPMPISVPVVATSATTDEIKPTKQEDDNNTNSKGDNIGNDDFPSDDVTDIDTDTNRVGV
jgi:HSF-type DNA-binding